MIHVQNRDRFVYKGDFYKIFIYIFYPNDKFISRIRSRRGVLFVAELNAEEFQNSQDFALHATPAFANVYLRQRVLPTESHLVPSRRLN